MKRYQINLTFDVLADDLPSEVAAEYRWTVIQAMESYAKSRKATAEEKQRIDKMLEDCNR